ncbi:hypothetical protein PAPYR_10025 [Paratrimastix pyriformis]|uniref:Uncharacterized protein n=1 Tax=Paratrimastix pyriformis TaxID=342808 RepID=A0ABQ8U6V1_9EUKA|nr:hypothetical protein PAPYR_10025 [Paratrimastix pyriformis]
MFPSQPPRPPISDGPPAGTALALRPVHMHRIICGSRPVLQRYVTNPEAHARDHHHTPAPLRYPVVGRPMGSQTAISPPTSPGLVASFTQLMIIPAQQGATQDSSAAVATAAAATPPTSAPTDPSQPSPASTSTPAAAPSGDGQSPAWLVPPPGDNAAAQPAPLPSEWDPFSVHEGGAAAAISASVAAQPGAFSASDPAPVPSDTPPGPEAPIILFPDDIPFVDEDEIKVARASMRLGPDAAAAKASEDSAAEAEVGGPDAALPARFFEDLAGVMTAAREIGFPAPDLAPIGPGLDGWMVGWLAGWLAVLEIGFPAPDLAPGLDGWMDVLAVCVCLCFFVSGGSDDGLIWYPLDLVWRMAGWLAASMRQCTVGPDRQLDLLSLPHNLIFRGVDITWGCVYGRLLVLTDNSILNVDPKAHTIQNEKLITEIDELITEIDEVSIAQDTHMSLRFSGADEEDLPQGGGPATPAPSATMAVLPAQSRSTLEDRLQRLYIFASASDCMAATSLILHMLSMVTRGEPLPNNTFAVKKVNRAGKPQPRVFKLTRGTLLNLDGTHIKTETPYADLEQVYLDPGNPAIVVIKFKFEEEHRSNICASPAQAQDLLRQLKEKLRTRLEPSTSTAATQ